MVISIKSQKIEKVKLNAEFISIYFFNNINGNLLLCGPSFVLNFFNIYRYTYIWLDKSDESLFTTMEVMSFKHVIPASRTLQGEMKKVFIYIHIALSKILRHNLWYKILNTSVSDSTIKSSKQISITALSKFWSKLETRIGSYCTYNFVHFIPFKTLPPVLNTRGSHSQEPVIAHLDQSCFQ